MKTIAFTILSLIVISSISCQMNFLQTPSNDDQVVVLGNIAQVTDTQSGTQIDVLNDQASVTYDGKDKFKTTITFHRPVVDQSEAIEVYKQISFIPTTKLNKKELSFFFTTGQIVKVISKRRGEFGDVYILLITIDGTNFTFSFLTAKTFPAKDDFYDLINSLGR